MTTQKPLEMTIGPEIMARALKAHSKAQSFNRWLLGVITLLTLINCGLMLMLDMRREAVLLLLAVVAFVGLLPPMQERFARVILRRQLRQKSGQGDLTRIWFTYDASGIAFGGGSKTLWNSYGSWREVDGLLMLYPTPRFFNLLDISQLPPEDVSAIRSHLDAQSPNPDAKKRK